MPPDASGPRNRESCVLGTQILKKRKKRMRERWRVPDGSSGGAGGGRKITTNHTQSLKITKVAKIKKNKRRRPNSAPEGPPLSSAAARRALKLSVGGGGAEGGARIVGWRRGAEGGKSP